MRMVEFKFLLEKPKVEGKPTNQKHITREHESPASAHGTISEGHHAVDQLQCVVQANAAYGIHTTVAPTRKGIHKADGQSSSAHKYEEVLNL